MSPAAFSNLGLPESENVSINTTPRDFSFDDHIKPVIGNHLASCLMDAGCYSEYKSDHSPPS